MKILLYCPLHPKTPKLFGRTNQAIFRQSYEPLEVWFSKGDNPHPRERDGKWTGRLNILHNYRKARRMALNNGFDALLTVEYDMVLPQDAVERLLACDADVAYGLYVFRATSTLSAFSRLDRRSGRSIGKDPHLVSQYWGQHYDSAGVGLGCTLIKREVLEKIDFRTEEGAANDWFFSIDVQEHGFRQVHDLGLVCGHMTMDPSPRILWPDPDMPKYYRNEFLDGIPVNNKGEVELEIGQLGEFYVDNKDLAPVEEG